MHEELFDNVAEYEARIGGVVRDGLRALDCAGVGCDWREVDLDATRSCTSRSAPVAQA